MVAECLCGFLQLGFLSDFDPNNVTFINTARNVVDPATGVEISPPENVENGEDALFYAIEWAGDSVGVLKELSNGDFIDARNDSGDKYGEVSLC